MIEGTLQKKRVLTLGADPELFVFNGAKLLPAFEFLPPKGKDTMIYWDGFQAEWKYSHPDNYCQNNLVKATRESLMKLQAKAKVTAPQARLSLSNVVRVPQSILKTADTPFVELGCQPSYNVYRMRGTGVPNPRLLPYRFAGGHMHFGTWTTEKPKYEKIVKMLDRILGVWAVGVARNIDNPIRRQYYGLAGEYRMPMYKEDRFSKGGYGVEYRTLSNFWLASPALMQVTWDIGRLCVRLATSKFGGLWIASEQEVIETINNCDYQQADKILDRNVGMLKWMLGQIYVKPQAITNALTISQVGLEQFVAEPEDFSTNWHFGDEWLPNARQPWARWER